MATDYARDRIRVRLFEFRPKGDGTFVDVVRATFIVSRVDVPGILSEAFEDIQADNLAFVCDALPDAPIALGHALSAEELGTDIPQAWSNLDSPAEGLARDETTSEADSGIGECARVRQLDDGRKCA